MHCNLRLVSLLTCLTLGLLVGGPAFADREFSGRDRFDLDRPEVQQWVDQTANDQKVATAEIYRILAKGEPQPKIIELMNRPAERVSPWYEYRARFLTEQRIKEGAEFYVEHRERLERAASDTGVAPEYIVAIIGVETFYGRITGRHRVLDALMTLAFDFPRRAEFFKSELANFLLLIREEAIDPFTALGSYAGAMGAPQFMPSSYRRYAVDGSNDQRRDLFSDWDDVVASVANYFAEHGWQRGGLVLVESSVEVDAPIVADPRNLKLNETIDGLKSKGVSFTVDLPGDTAAILIPAELRNGPSYRVGFKNFEVITRYNRSLRYAMAVHELAGAIAARVPVAVPVSAVTPAPATTIRSDSQ
ncbi:MAG: lytic murein transglycosylase B [Proteobacteria bacterium]|nr:lytic murein transglycosylase B [Pseudomonadota bacterium]